MAIVPKCLVTFYFEVTILILGRFGNIFYEAIRREFELLIFILYIYYNHQHHVCIWHFCKKMEVEAHGYRNGCREWI